MNQYGLILAGGGGTRFWPLSRQANPKQFLNLTGEELMINEAFDRMALVIPPEDIYVITSAQQAEAMLKLMNGRITADRIIVEPAARNTAACIGLAAEVISRRRGDGVMLITPADHYIRDWKTLSGVFRDALREAEERGCLMTIGISPTFPSTGYGYIRYDMACPDTAKPVFEFREKPDLETAKAYLASGAYVWNSGMFIWKTDVILGEMRRRVPDIAADLDRIGAAVGTPEEARVLREVYPDIRRISIDYAILEPASLEGDVCLIPGDFGWDDVGSWDMMETLHTPDSDGNVLLGDTLSVRSTGCVAYSTGKLITLVDVQDLVVVQTDDAILVCSKAHAQNVKHAVERLQAEGRRELL